MTEPTRPAHHRPIRSFVVRGGRLTPSQQEALDQCWPLYGVDDTQAPLDHETLFGRTAPLVLEIGFGMGDSLARQAEAEPERDFIGIEVHRPGVGKLLREIHDRNLTNLRLYCHDATEILTHCIAEESLDTIQIFFPDPWHKKKHHKRRLIQPGFVRELTNRLKPGGHLHLATDWTNYAEHMMAVLSAEPSLVNTAGEGQFSQNTGRPQTRFERRGERLGHPVFDLVFARVRNKP
ncbi:MAG: tRNA (guanosine(46)-N7)-methyltransferase TrmB [Pseudohongiellaceae bacterium]